MRMGKEKFSLGISSHCKFKSKGLSEMKIVVGFFTVLALAAIMLSSLYFPSTSFTSFHLSRIRDDCNEELQNRPLEQEKHQDLKRQMIATIDVRQRHSSRSISRLAEYPPTKQLEQEKQILREWEMPTVAEDRDYEKLHDESYGVPRKFIPIGVGSFLFVQFGAYRGSSNSFGIVGLGPKSLHVYGNPDFECYWESLDSSTKLSGNATKYLPDWGYGRQYTVIVINCTFDSDVGTDGGGGHLGMVATHGEWDRTGLEDSEFVALTEKPGEYNGSIFEAPYKYDYLYCGSPLHGDISPQRMREWISYHMMLFGPRSHFILYDAGGIHDEVWKILDPWVKLGRVTILNVRQEERYDTYYYNQFLMVNDCLLRSKSLANWTFFFDVDEFIHVPWYYTFDFVMSEINKFGRNATQVVFDQNPMSQNACLSNITFDSDQNISSVWMMEKLTYKRTEITEPFGFMDKKYAIQSKYALSTGVHRSENLTYEREGMTLDDATMYENWRLHYYHYHNTINRRDEICQEFINPLVNVTNLNNVSHEFDDTMVSLASSAREFELRTVGLQPTII